MKALLGIWLFILLGLMATTKAQTCVLSLHFFSDANCTRSSQYPCESYTFEHMRCSESPYAPGEVFLKADCEEEALISFEEDGECTEGTGVTVPSGLCLLWIVEDVWYSFVFGADQCKPGGGSSASTLEPLWV
ncbi:hypothetical protein QOT17_015255 [Balamuthia mandrillaris]